MYTATMDPELTTRITQMAVLAMLRNQAKKGLFICNIEFDRITHRYILKEFQGEISKVSSVVATSGIRCIPEVLEEYDVAMHVPVLIFDKNIPTFQLMEYTPEERDECAKYI